MKDWLTTQKVLHLSFAVQDEWRFEFFPNTRGDWAIKHIAASVNEAPIEWRAALRIDVYDAAGRDILYTLFPFDFSKPSGPRSAGELPIIYAYNVRPLMVVKAPSAMNTSVIVFVHIAESEP